MADIVFLGHIEGIRYNDTSIIVVASERKKGYKKKDGTIIDDELLSFRFIFKSSFRKYISEHFSSGMLVKIKGVLFPYAKDHQGNIIDGYSIIGQTIDLAPYPSNNIRIEKKRIKESQSASDETPDLNAFNQPDF